MGEFTSAEILKVALMNSHLARTFVLMIQKPDRIASSPATIRKTALLLLSAGMASVVPLLALAFSSSVIDPFPQSAPPM
jgi:hypothetical protein